MAGADVVYLINDMLFASKLRETAAQLGLNTQSVRQSAALVEAARQARLVVVDLRVPTALEALEQLAADPQAKSVPSVGFIDHEKVDVMEQAEARGCRQVMAKGQFAAVLPRLLGELAADSTGRAPSP